MYATRTDKLYFFINATFALLLTLLHIFIIRSRAYVYTSFITYLLVRPAHNKSTK